jgi:hypothetical protein
MHVVEQAHDGLQTKMGIHANLATEVTEKNRGCTILLSILQVLNYINHFQVLF